MKLKRADDRYLAGVCGGIANQFGINPFFIRIVWVVVAVLSFLLPALLVYLLLWAIMVPPEE